MTINLTFPTPNETKKLWWKYRRLSLVLMLLLPIIPNNLIASETPHIAILPFTIHSKENICHLQTKLNDLLELHFENAGAVVVKHEEISDHIKVEEVGNENKARKIGMKTGADYVIWGNMIRVEQHFSIDIKIIESFSSKPMDTFFIGGVSMENLFSIVKEIADKIVMKIFKYEKISEVVVSGNNYIESNAILRKISTKKGEFFSPQRLSEDLKSLYKMGYFEDIRIEAEQKQEGKKIIFNVKENSKIRKIQIKGNKVCNHEKIQENLDIKIASILNISAVQRNIARIEELYKNKNYQNIKIKYKIRELGNNQADLELIIEEGEKVLIKEIRFIGNTVYSEKELKKLIKTSQKGFFSWLTESGELKEANLQQDTEKINAFYKNNGYIFAKIGEPKIEYKKNWIYITIEISEGSRFKVGKVKVSGKDIKEDELREELKIKDEEFFNRDVIRNDVLLLTDIYSDKGYAYAEVKPKIEEDLKNQLVNITYNIGKGRQVYFEKIIIKGNTKTRDKVIRRELKVYEQEFYSGKALKQGIRNLYRLDFFQSVEPDIIKGSTDDSIILNIKVTEKSTDSLIFGGGYSSSENFYTTIALAQRNFLGGGQELKLKADLSSSKNKYIISFSEPWLFDIPLSAGIDIFNWETDYDTYEKASLGFGLKSGYTIFDFTRVYLSYSFEIANIKNVSVDASDSIWEMEGENTQSDITASLRYDSRDSIFNPTEGSKHSISVQYAGLGGGDIAFTKYIADTGWYFPLFNKTVGFVHSKCGYVQKNSVGVLPTYERFNLGGINSLRGFDWEDLSPTKPNAENETTYIGGNKFVQFNFELLYPLFEKSGLMGVVFFDTGDVYNDDELIDIADLRKSAGFGFRWYSPLGPIRIEYGHVIDGKEGESNGNWEFTMGAAF